MLVVAIVVVAILLAPDSAHAWGPISHLAHGSEVLKNLTILGLGLQRLLRRYPQEYLYGCVGADITMGKQFARAMHLHCHSWNVGWQVLDGAESDAERAFAYGYLTHLACDIYAHNHFVPTQLIVSYPARTLRHIYWETRFDSMQPVEYRQLVRAVRRQGFPDCDELFQRVVTRTLFSFETNKRIFDSILAFTDWNHWHVAVERVSARSAYQLPPEVVRQYNNACRDAALDLLRHGKRSACQEADPTGMEALALAHEVRSTLKALNRRGKLSASLRRQVERLNRRVDLSQIGPPGAGLDIGGARS